MKIRKILLRTVGILAALYAIVYVVRFQTTLPVEGVVVDAKTGKPVSKVLVHASWHFSYSNLVDTTGGGFGYGTVTGEDGRFRIPRKNATVVFGRFDDQYLVLKHPLYDFREQQVYVEMYKKHPVGTVEDGVLKVTLPIESLEDKYSRPEDISALARAIDNCGPEFYETMLEKFAVQYDLDEVMTTLQRIASRFLGPDYQKNEAYRAYLYHEIVMKDFKTSYK